MIELRLIEFDYGTQVALGFRTKPAEGEKDSGLFGAARWPIDADASTIANALRALAWKMEKEYASR